MRELRSNRDTIAEANVVQIRTRRIRQMNEYPIPYDNNALVESDAEVQQIENKGGPEKPRSKKFQT